MIPLRSWQDCYLPLAIIDLSEPKDFVFGDIIVQISYFLSNNPSIEHFPIQKQKNEKNIMHFTIEPQQVFLASRPNIHELISAVVS